MAVSDLKLASEALRGQYDDDQLPSTTAGLTPLDTIAGQARALDAIEFGLSMDADGYNIAVAGRRGSGRNTAVRLLLEQRAPDEDPANDWVYLFNFADPYRPKAVAVAPGLGDDLKRALSELVQVLEADLPAAFDTDEYQERSGEALRPINDQREELLTGLNRSAQLLGFGVSATPAGFAPVPLTRDGSPMSPELIRQLPDADRQDLDERGKQVMEDIARTVRELRTLDKQARQAIDALNKEVARFTLQPTFDDLRATFTGEDLRAHLDAIEADVLEHLEVLRRSLPEGPMSQGPMPNIRAGILRRYDVNLFVTHGDEAPDGAPVVDERQPTYYNLFGRLDFETQFGTVTTDFTQIRPGALHMANGGYLILQAEDLLSDPRSWLKLKRSLKTKQVRVEDTSDFGLPLPTLHLVPEPIPLDLKVVLVGSMITIAMLDALDPDFQSLFKIRAEFEPDTPVNTETIAAYAGFICREAGLCDTDFDRSAMREVLRFGNRLAGRQDRLSTEFSAVADLCREAHQIARAAGDAVVVGGHIREAVRAMDRRAELVPTRNRRMIAEGTLHIETSGSVTGQVNGLAVYQIGRQRFGTPTRITCRIGAGTAGVVAIERETERSGAIHSKGVLVLSGYLMGTFGRTHPLSFSASVTFEQSYDEVDGDSASSAELYAILTALADVPIRQDIAVTGSVDQFGNVQPVGGVTEKVEGFFAVCREVGLTGTQGVIVPASNAINLTLAEDVVEAVEAGQFHLWAVSRIEEGLELLSGEAAGEADAEGHFPPESILGRVEAALLRMRPAPPAPGAFGRPQPGDPLPALNRPAAAEPG